MKKIDPNNILVDTDVLIDLGYGVKKAAEFLDEIEIQITWATYMEMLAGARNKTELKQIEEALKSHKIVYPNKDILNLASEIYKKETLSGGIGIIDSTIAATALTYDLQLATKNLKHYKNIKGLKVIKPY